MEIIPPDLLSWFDENRITNTLDRSVLEAAKLLFERKENTRAFISATYHLGIEGWSSEGFLSFYGRDEGEGGLIMHQGLWYFPISGKYRGGDIAEVILEQASQIQEFLTKGRAAAVNLFIPTNRKVMVDNIHIFDKATDGGYHEAPWPAFYSCGAFKPEIFVDRMKELRELYQRFINTLPKA